MDAAIIDEVDWNQTIKISDELTVHALPARHFSGRGLKRNQTLWASLFVTRRKRFITAAIAAMARILRPLANSLALSIWQSWKTVNMTQDWKYIHMMPEETAQPPMIYAPGRYYRGMPDAVLAKQLGRSVPAAGGSEGREWRLVTPMLGEPVWVADKTQSFNAWWR